MRAAPILWKCQEFATACHQPRPTQILRVRDRKWCAITGEWIMFVPGLELCEGLNK